MNNKNIIIIGAGPVGLSAAAQLLARGMDPIILEKGPSAGHAMLQWGHVRVFTPWQYVTDNAVLNLLQPTGWVHPEKAHLPTGKEIVEEYLVPAATSPRLKDRIIYNATVTAVSKRGLSKSSTSDREDVPFTVHYSTTDSEYHILEADAVIDASGTWHTPNPIGSDGLTIPGEKEFSEYISYGIPETLGKDKELHKGKRTLVLGGGHSAINVILDILKLKDEDANTKLVWGLRRNKIEKLLGGGINDKLPARGALGVAAKKAIDDGVLQLFAPMSVQKIDKVADGLSVEILVDGVVNVINVDRIVVAAGFRPDLEMLREVRLNLDEVVEAPTVLAPMIDPNLHSCGTVRPHGIDELSHPDKNFFIVGMKAYGRAPTFLMKTGYEQVRSIADELVGNHKAARIIELDLPETGVCNSKPQSSVSSGGGCCEVGSVETETQASSCCGSAPSIPTRSTTSCCG